MSELPILGLLVPRPPPEPVAGLLARMSWWCEPRAAAPGDPAPAAWLATAPDAPGLVEVAARRPTAVWVDEADGLPRAAAAAPDGVVVTPSPAVALASAEPVIVVGGSEPGPRFVPPFVRERLRQAAGLASPLVLDLREGGPATLRGDLLDTALAVCSAAAVAGPLLGRALAWGTPAATDAASAAAAGAHDGTEVLVGADGDLLELAGALAADQRRAAALSRAARRLSERAHGDPAAAARLVQRLGLSGDAPGSAHGAVELQLELLITPPRSRVRDRAFQSLAGLDRGIHAA